MSKPVKKGAPDVGLWVRIGPDLDPDWLIRELKQVFFVINNSAYERNMHVLEISGNADDARFAGNAITLFELAHHSGIATIWRGSPIHAKALKADGVLVDSLKSIKQARDLYGAEGIVGLQCGLSQDLARQAQEAGIDFVSFGTGKDTLPAPEALRFWATISDKPALVEGPMTNDYCAYFIENGATFLDAGAYVFSHGKGAMQGTVNMLHAIDLALADQKTPVVQ